MSIKSPNCIASFEFAGTNYDLLFYVYSHDDSPALVLFDTDEQLPFRIITRVAHNKPPYIEDSMIILDDISAHDGLLDLLIEEGIVSHPEFWEFIDMKRVPVCTFLCSNAISNKTHKVTDHNRGVIK